MKLKDLLTEETYQTWGDMDVTNDCIDELTCTWCGETLTEAGAEHFKEALDLGAHIAPVWGSAGIVIEIDHLKHYNKAWRQACELFSAMAGYCTEEEWEAWFKSA